MHRPPLQCSVLAQELWKTYRCVCKKHDQGCTPGKCKCKSLKCCRQKDDPAVDIAVLGEANSSGSEPEYFCICEDECSTTLCYCLAIKQVPCSSQCKWRKATARTGQ